MLLAQRDQEIEVTLPRYPNRKSSPATHHLDPETRDQKRLHELDRRQRAQTGIEAQKRDSIERQRPERAQLLPETGETRRRILSRKEFLRLRFERDEGSRNRSFAAEHRELPDQRPMAKVHPVEVPDRGHAAVVFGPYVVPAADHFQLDSPQSYAHSTQPEPCCSDAATRFRPLMPGG